MKAQLVKALLQAKPSVICHALKECKLAFPGNGLVLKFMKLAKALTRVVMGDSTAQQRLATYIP